MIGFKSLFSKPDAIPRLTSSKGDIIQIPPPQFILIPFEYPGQNFYKPTVCVGEPVRQNQIVGQTALGSCLHTSVSGIVRDIFMAWSARGFKVPMMLIQRTDEPPMTVEEIYASLDMSPDTISEIEKLRIMGVLSPWSTPARYHRDSDVNYPEIKKIVVKGVNEEPSVFIFEHLLRKDIDKIKRGFEYLAKLAPRAEIYLTVPESDVIWAKQTFDASIKVVGLSDNYRDRIEQLTVAQISGIYVPYTQSYREFELGVISSEYLLTLVDALDDIGPFVTKHASIARSHTKSIPTVEFPLGMTIRNILQAINLDETLYARILVGGPLKGVAQFTSLTPLTKGAHGLFLLEPYELIEEVDFICTNCGLCTRHCPLNLQVHLLGRFAEFSLYEETRALHPEACNECGICSYVCPAHRSLVQLIQMCKKHIGISYEKSEDQIQCRPESTLEKWAQYI